MYISEEIIQNLERILQLPFVHEAADGNVCFAGKADTDIRPEYRQTFTFRDIELYLQAVNQTDFTQQSFPYPADATDFWKQMEDIKKG